MKEESIQLLQSSQLILDTNILIDSSKEPDDFTPFYSILEEANVRPFLDPITKIEFLKGSSNRKTEKLFEEFIDKLYGDKSKRVELDTHKETFSKLLEHAKRISIIYNSLRNKSVKLGDLLISAIAASYHNVIIATQNHSDFLPPLFKPVEDIIIRTKNDKVKCISFYSFSKDKYHQLCFDLGFEAFK